jgi:hypothetical protein
VRSVPQLDLRQNDRLFEAAGGSRRILYESVGYDEIARSPLSEVFLDALP